jgi:hypothetical protein
MAKNYSNQIRTGAPVPTLSINEYPLPFKINLKLSFPNNLAKTLPSPPKSCSTPSLGLGYAYLLDVGGPAHPRWANHPMVNGIFRLPSLDHALPNFPGHNICVIIISRFLRKEKFESRSAVLYERAVAQRLELPRWKDGGSFGRGGGLMG